jgi:hypothetical protein
MTHHVTFQSGDFTHHNVICRFKRKYDVIPSSSLGPRADNTKRSSKLCDVAFRIVEYNDHVKFHVTENQLILHNHSLDEIKAAELGKEPLFSETNTCFCRFVRSY